MSLFETATKKKYRFQTAKGFLSVEDLWDLRLSTTAVSGTSLDTVAQDLFAKLKATQAKSFVNTANTQEHDELENKLEVVKHIIAVKQAEALEAKRGVLKAEEKRRLTELLQQKQDEKLGELSEEEIKKRLSEL